MKQAHSTLAPPSPVQWWQPVAEEVSPCEDRLLCTPGAVAQTYRAVLSIGVFM